MILNGVIANGQLLRVPVAYAQNRPVPAQAIAMRIRPRVGTQTQILIRIFGEETRSAERATYAGQVIETEESHEE